MYKADLIKTDGNGVAHNREEQPILSHFSKLLFLIFVTYLVLPIFDIPLLGLSISAPILFLVFLNIVSTHSQKTTKLHLRWVIIGYILWLGLLSSLVGNNIFRNIDVSTSDIVTLIRFAYWIIAFLTTSIVISTISDIDNLYILLGFSILLLGGYRLYEAIFFGRWGAWTNTELMSQNSYGFQFSSYFPFALILPLTLKGYKRAISSMALILLILAIAINGSRSSWITTIISSTLLVIIYLYTNRKLKKLIVSRTIIILLGFVLLFTNLPTNFLSPVVARFETFNTLDSDRSFIIRELMIQKGLRLFEDNPIFGAGIGRFTVSSVPLDIPTLLRYADQSHFDVKSSHNSYIAFLGETGLVGTIPFLFLHLSLILGGLSASIRLAKHGHVWPIAVFCSYIGMSIHLWSLSGLTSTSPWFIYGMVAGIIVRATIYQDKEVHS